MKIENTKGVTRYYDYEIEKAFHQYERGVSFYNYFKHKAQKFKYGEMAYYDILKKEIEDYEQRNWDYLIEMGQMDPIEVYEILENVKKIKKTLDLLASQQNGKDDLNENIDKQINSESKQFINEAFEAFDKQGWEYSFRTKKDYNLFTDLLTDFFDKKNPPIPEIVIELKRACKTKTATVLKEIHKELGFTKLANDTEFFKIIRLLSHFKDEPESDLYKALTR